MYNTIKIKGGCQLSVCSQIPLLSKAENTGSYTQYSAEFYAVKPTDFIGLKPQLLVKETDQIKAGEALFCDKKHPETLFCSPINGKIVSVKRGENRRLEAIVISKSNDDSQKIDIGHQPEQIKKTLLSCGLATTIRQRPFATSANLDQKPKYIIVKCFDKAPWSLNYAKAISMFSDNAAKLIYEGAKALSSIYSNHIFFCTDASLDYKDSFSLLSKEDIENRATILAFEGKYPASNVSVLIDNIARLKKDETVWYIDVQDLLNIGELFASGTLAFKKVICINGSENNYYLTTQGACVTDLLKEQGLYDKEHIRFVSGSPLSGSRIGKDEYISVWDNCLSIMEEGDKKEMFGWIMPSFSKFSLHRCFLNGFANLLPCGCKKPIKITANTHGDERAMVFTDKFESLVPLDIYPLHLLKACIIKDIEQMEKLGILEVAGEDFALCEVADASKTPWQAIINEGLEMVRKETEE